MNQELKTRWVAALRSGEYQQGRAVLRQNSQFCCLGVLCDLVDNTRWRRTDASEIVYTYAIDEYPHTAMPPAEVYAAAGLSDDDGSTLADANDNGKSFEFIADYIEEHL